MPWQTFLREPLPLKRNTAHAIEVSFQDTGKGIQPEHLSKLFDPGFTTKGRGVGTGLGLALCYKIIEKHHGSIQVHSNPGEGACFTVLIPVVQVAT
jgi:two-component system, NtrC family, sensor kinase